MKFLNPPLIFLSAFLIRLMVYGASIGDSIVIAGLAALYAYTMYLKSIAQPKIAESLVKELSDLKNTVVAMKMGRSMQR